VILINLLPHREEKRRQRKRAFFASLVACALAGVAIVGVWYSVLQQMTAAQESRNSFLRAEIARLDTQIKDIATLRAEIEAPPERPGRRADRSGADQRACLGVSAQHAVQLAVA
jgi:type IV pilus assembly protein PilN